MAILNYTTKIDVNKSVAEVQKILGTKGARSITVDYDEQGQPSAVMFSLDVCGNLITFRLPQNTEGVYRSLCRAKGVPYRLQTRDQARRVSWRILKDWVEAQMAVIESGQAEMAEVFMPYALDNTGRTAFQAFKESQQLLLTAGEASH
jgi:hypothetical protein